MKLKDESGRGWVLNVDDTLLMAETGEDPSIFWINLGGCVIEWVNINVGKSKGTLVTMAQRSNIEKVKVMGREWKVWWSLMFSRDKCGRRYEERNGLKAGNENIGNARKPVEREHDISRNKISLYESSDTNSSIWLWNVVVKCSGEEEPWCSRWLM